MELVRNYQHTAINIKRSLIFRRATDTVLRRIAENRRRVIFFYYSAVYSEAIAGRMLTTQVPPLDYKHSIFTNVDGVRPM